MEEEEGKLEGGIPIPIKPYHENNNKYRMRKRKTNANVISPLIVGMANEVWRRISAYILIMLLYWLITQATIWLMQSWKFQEKNLGITETRATRATSKLCYRNVFCIYFLKQWLLLLPCTDWHVLSWIQCPLCLNSHDQRSLLVRKIHLHTRDHCLLLLTFSHHQIT